MDRYLVSIDIGGTFTDVVLFDKKKGEYITEKVPTTPRNLTEGALNGVMNKISDLGNVESFVHGTTVGLNTLLERRGSKMALIVTKGTRDAYLIGRANRPEIYNIHYRKPEPLMERKDIYEVDERVLVSGEIDKPLDVAALNDIIEKLKAENYDTVSISLLHGYRNPVHEKEIKQVLQKELPNISISPSHEIIREWREYERISTTVTNAYIAPIMEKYLTKLENEAANRKLNKEIYIMQSNGGVMTSAIAKEKPVQTLMSGPVGGTMGSISLDKEKQAKQNLICVDMGGTSFDVSMVLDGEPEITNISSIHELPILSPMVNIQTIGAGGGSIAWLEGGGLRVGPRSAGAEPGPACYGRGGTEPTVTDANLVLGRISSKELLGGNMQLDKEAAYKAIEKIAKELDLSVIKTAEGICKIADAQMADATRRLTVSKGIDPREFTMVAYGGAGPMHAAHIADNLGIDRILIPKVAGTFSAQGMLETDVRHDDVRTFITLLENCDKDALESQFIEMKTEATKVLEEQKVSADNISFTELADLRYVGQEYTVTVALTGDSFDDEMIEKLTEDFHEKHINLYGHHLPDSPVEIVNVRIVGTGKLMRELSVKEEKEVSAAPTASETRTVVWNNAQLETNIYNHQSLKYGQTIEGPAIIESNTFTTVVPDSFKVRVGKDGILELNRRHAK